MIAMIATSWAVSTVISIPPLFGLKDPVIDEDRIYNYSGHFRRQPGALADAVGGPFKPPVLGEYGGDLAFSIDWNGDASSTVRDKTNDSNNTVEIETINCVISQNFDNENWFSADQW